MYTYKHVALSLLHKIVDNSNLEVEIMPAVFNFRNDFPPKNSEKKVRKKYCPKVMPQPSPFDSEF